MVKKLAYFIIVSVFFSTLVFSADYGTIIKKQHRYYLNCNENVYISLRGTSVIFKQKFGSESTVEILKNGNLMISGKPIKTGHEQQKLLRYYNKTFRHMIESVELVEKKAVKITKEGVEVGLSAVSGVLAGLWTESNMDELKEELEAKADHLEEKAEDLEDAVQEIEAYTEKLDEIHNNLVQSIPELEELNWF